MQLTGWLRRNPGSEFARDIGPLSFDEYLNYFSYNGQQYGLGFQQTLQGDTETIAGNFAGIVEGAYRANGVVFACQLVRLSLFSQARFQFQRLTPQGRWGALYGTAGLVPLERPWPGGTTADLLARMIQDADLSGNSYTLRGAGGRMDRLRPDWVTIILGSRSGADEGGMAPDAEVLGYSYKPGGPGSTSKPQSFAREQICHFAPTPDPGARFRGMSWLTPVINEVIADKAMTTHKGKFFEQGATPNMIVKLDRDINPTAFKEWTEIFKAKSEGLENAYKTLYLGAGADATVVGANLRQIDFKTVQGGGETRVAAAAGVPPVIVGLSEGLQAATYSNYAQARRALSDQTLEWLWLNAAGSMQTIVPAPDSTSRLTFDRRDIPFLKEDVKDEAEIGLLRATTLKMLTDAGYTPESAVAAVDANDIDLLEHSGLFSVQLQPAGTTAPTPDVPAPADAAANGNRTLEIAKRATNVQQLATLLLTAGNG